MSGMSGKASRFALVALLCAPLAPAQGPVSPESVPPNFTADAKFAAQIRSQLFPNTKPATGRYSVGKQVLDRLVEQLPDNRHFSWNLRIANHAGNIFSSPDGTLFIDESMASLLGSQPGLWAAALSHEIAHVTRRDWARRYLFEKSLQQGGTGQLSLGDSLSGSWTDPKLSSTRLAEFCRTMELEADADGLMLMARAGFHPDFVPALHHVLKSQELDAKVLDSSHPGWDERDEKLKKSYAAAGSEFDRRWPARYTSPGGNPPVVVYAGLPAAKRDSAGRNELLVPLHCQNLAGSVEVVLRWSPADSNDTSEQRQFTGCTSNRTLLTFILPAGDRPRLQAEISVLDDSGAILNRSLSRR